jgi:hypothetical protein
VREQVTCCFVISSILTALWPKQVTLHGRHADEVDLRQSSLWPHLLQATLSPAAVMCHVILLLSGPLQRHRH